MINHCHRIGLLTDELLKHGILFDLLAPERNPAKIVLSFVIALLAVAILLFRTVASLWLKPAPIPFDGLLLIFWHSFQEKSSDRTSNFVALEIDRFRVRGPIADASIFLISNSGLAHYNCRIDCPTRRIVEFQGRPIDGMYAVFWAPAGADRIMIYDAQSASSRGMMASCYWRPKHCTEFSGERRGEKGVERFCIMYSRSSGLELEARNQGVLNGRTYLELYRLIYDNAGA